MTNAAAAISRAEIIKAAGNIEPLPATLTRLVQLLADEAFDMGELVDTLIHDPTLAGDVLGRANSTASGARRYIGDLREAVARIGAREVLAIAMRRAMKSRFSIELPPYGLDADELWRHSIAASVAAEAIRMKSTTPIAPMISTTALIHDVGKLVIGQCVPAGVLKMLGEAAAGEGLTLHEAELRVLGIDHAEIGCVVARTWGLPISVQIALTQHHAPETEDAFTHALVLADRVSHAALAYSAEVVDDVNLDYSDAIEAARGHVPDVAPHLEICGLAVDDIAAMILKIAADTDEILADYD